MLITANTKIGAIIKSNPAAIDVLITVNKHFIKLKNPVLRKILAPRVTIAEAAKIGNCSVTIILESLSTIGFEIETKSFINDIPIVPEEDKRTFAYDGQLDVRQELANGVDPFNLIMNKVAEMLYGQTLLLINSFEPVPLIRILRGKGYTISVSCINTELTHTYITKNNTQIENVQDINQHIQNADSFKKVFTEYKDNIVEIDVRDLAMPQPMITILNAIEQLPPGKALYVHHKKVPVFLLPELQERGFQYAIIQEGEGVEMMIFPEKRQ